MIRSVGRWIVAAIGTDSVTIYTAPTSHYHAEGGTAFGPDGMLYVSVGDALSPRLAPVNVVAPMRQPLRERDLSQCGR